MKHFIALIIKFALVGLFLELALRSLTTVRPINILLISLLITIISYGLGDLLILDRTNNTVAMIADIVTSFVILYASNYIFRFTLISLRTAAITSIVLGLGEWVFHKYVRRAVFPPGTL